MAHGREVLDELRAGTKELREHIPDVYKAYGSLNSAVFTDGALDAKTKELIALAIGVGKECDGCIASHARRAARKGATPDEVAEALGVAVLMNGGPGTVYAPRAFEAFQEFQG